MLNITTTCLLGSFIYLFILYHLVVVFREKGNRDKLIQAHRERERRKIKRFSEIH